MNTLFSKIVAILILLSSLASCKNSSTSANLASDAATPAATNGAWLSLKNDTGDTVIVQKLGANDQPIFNNYMNNSSIQLTPGETFRENYKVDGNLRVRVVTKTPPPKELVAPMNLTYSGSSNSSFVIHVVDQHDKIDSISENNAPSDQSSPPSTENTSSSEQ